jgi:hypothetical protein
MLGPRAAAVVGWMVFGLGLALAALVVVAWCYRQTQPHCLTDEYGEDYCPPHDFVTHAMMAVIPLIVAISAAIWLRVGRKVAAAKKMPNG